MYPQLTGSYSNPTWISSLAWSKISSAPSFLLAESDPKVGSNTANYLSKWNGTALVASGIFDNGTNVGIGTSSPTTKLEVTGGDAKINGITVGKGGGFVNSNTAVGSLSLNSNTTGSLNTANGANALITNTTGGANTATGGFALANNLNGNSNTANGSYALYQNSTGSLNSAFGGGVLYSNTTGGSNSGIGYQTLYSNTSGGSNSSIGYNALYSNTEGVNNTACGYNAIYSNTTGGYNTAIGNQALNSNTVGHNNTAIGNFSLFANSVGDLNTAIGYNASVSAGYFSNATAIGASAMVGQSNSLVLGSINGVNGATADTKVGIGTSTPVAKLDVVGTIKITDGTQGISKVLTSDANGLASWKSTSASSWSLNGNSGILPSSNYIGTNDNISVRFRTNSIQRMIIDSLGKVGIGTTSPQQALSVKGGMNIDQGDANTGTVNNSLRFGNASGEAIGSNRNPGANLFGLDLYTNGINRMSIANNGNVGINTTSPNAKLEIKDGNLRLFNSADNKNYEIAYEPNGDYLYFDEFGGGRRLVIASGGLVGINTTTPSSGYYLTVAGSALASGGTWVNSDKRYKLNIQPMKNALESVLQLRGVTYDNNTKEYPEWKFDDTKQIGVIAQEVEKILPELVKTDDKGYKAVNYEKLTPVLIEAIKEQQKQIDAKDVKINKQQEQLDKQQAQIDAILQELHSNTTVSKTNNQYATIENNDVPMLEQNIPNPLKGTTIIKYYVPTRYKTAQVSISNTKGEVIKIILLKALGKGQVILNVGTLASGTYFYSLLADDKMIMTKEMQVAR